MTATGYRHDSITLESAAEDADDWTAGEPRPDTVYRVDGGGGMTWSLCGECIAYVSPPDGSPVNAGAPTADRCRGCGLSGAPARWATARRGAELWRGLLVGLDGLEVDPLTGRPWDAVLARPGLPNGCRGWRGGYLLVDAHNERTAR